jgi:hypothetical protein
MAPDHTVTFAFSRAAAQARIGTGVGLGDADRTGAPATPRAGRHSCQRTTEKRSGKSSRRA